MVVDSFQQHRASVIGGGSGETKATPTLASSFQQHRAQVISQPIKPVTTPTPTPVSTPVAPVSKGPSFVQKAGEAVKRKATGVVQGLGDVATSLLDAVQMVAERYESKKPVKETKKVTGELPKPITSLLREDKKPKPLTPVQEQVQKVSKESPTPLTPKSQIYSVASEPIKRWSEEVNPKDPTFADMLARGVGSMGGYLLLSSITGLGAGSLALVEAASEAGSVYSTNREKGMSVDEASQRADKDFLANLVINYATNKLGLFGDGANKIKKAIVSATTEGTQEALQQITSNSQTDRPIMEGVLESAGVGAIIGGSISVIMPDGSVAEITGEQTKEKISVKNAKNISEIDPTQVIGGVATPTTASVETTDETLKTLVKLDSAITNYKGDQGVTILPSKEVTQSPALRELTALSSKPEVIAKTQSQVATLPRDEDGKITLYRVGTLRPGDNRLVSASVTREAAQEFADLQSVSKEARPLTEFKVNPEDIKIFIGGTEAEVLVQNPVNDVITPEDEPKIAEALRSSKGLSADDIVKKYPDINLKRDVVVTDIYGKKSTIDKGEALTPYEMKGGKVVLQDGETYIVSKNQYQNVKGNAISKEAKEFAPELKQTEETVKGRPNDPNLTPSMDESVKYSQYQLPGGENYREILIKAPKNEELSKKPMSEEQFNDLNDMDSPYTNYEEYVESFKKGQDVGADVMFKSSHWNEPNVLAHIRLNERKYQDKPVTFIEEIQSDWAREARAKGIDITPERRNELDKRRLEIEALGKEATPAQKQEWVDIMNELKPENSSRVPGNELLKNWQEMAVKRSLLEAVNNKSEYMAWINGEQTSARYNLSTMIDKVIWNPSQIGGKTVKLAPKDGNREIGITIDKDGVVIGSSESTWTGKKLDEVIGKGLADRIMSDEQGTLSGDGLKFGGEWAVNLYDKQFKSIVEKLTGGKVETIDMDLPVTKTSYKFRTNINANRMPTADLTVDNMEAGKVIYDETLGHMTITEVLGNGKFKAVDQNFYDSMKARWLDMEGDQNWERRLSTAKTFDLSTTMSSGQQSIQLTPEIVSKIKSEAPVLKEPSGKDPFAPTEKIPATEAVMGEDSPPLLTDKVDLPEVSTENVIVNSKRGGELTISPSTATTVEEVLEEVKALGLPESVVKSVYTTKLSDKMKYGGRMVVGYTRPYIGKTELRTLLTNAPEFKDNPVLTVDHNKNLVFEGQRVHFSIKPEALQISTDNIKPGDTIRVDEETLKKGSQQLRIRSSKGDVLGFNPKNLADPFSPKATEEMQAIVKQSDIAKTLSEKLGVPIRRGKFRKAGAIGIYKGSPKVIRIKKGGLNTVFHEVAHYLDDTIGLSDNISATEVESLVQEYGNPPQDPKRRKMEAFAEYMRFRMTGQTEKIKEWAPEFDKAFSEKIETMKDVKSVIETATQDYSRWAALPSTSKILSQLSIGAQKESSFKDRVVQSAHELYASVLDDLHPLSEFSGLAKSRIGNIKAVEDPYVLARNLRGWVGKADMFLNQGTFKKEFWKVGENGKIQMNFTGKSYSEIMKPLEEMKALDDFRVFIVAERIVNDLAPRKIETGISLSDAETALAELKAKYPTFEAISAERRAYKDSLLEYAKDTGLIGEKGLKQIKELNKYHVPFYRVMEETGAKFLGKSKIGGNLSSPIKKIKGSEREIIDPLESDVKDTYAIINASERNSIGVAMANLAGQNFELGRLFEKVDAPMKGTKVNVGEVLEKATKGTEAEGLEIPEGLAEAVVTLFRPTQASGPNMLNVNLGDKKAVYEVDPDLFKAIQGLNIEDVGIVMKILSFPASLLRAGATLSPDFSVRNPLRDQFTAYVYSKHGFIPGIDLVRGMFELFKKGDTYNLWKAGGGEHATFVSLDRLETQKTLKQILKSKGMQNLDYVKNPVNLLRIISELGEMGTRLGEMRNALARGTNPVEAAYDARNVTLDFSRVGAKTRAVNAIIAFFNANIQASDTMVRKFKNRPFQSLFKAMISMTLPSVLLYFANRDDDRWKEIPQWQKDLFWIVLTKDHIWRIPKPFELGILFGSVPERILEVIDTKDPEMLNELRRTIVNGFTPGFLPTTLIPIIENITNYSFFTDRPIVSRGKENLPPEQQAGPYTTEVSKILGEALNYSPAKIDNLVQGYGGGIGKYVTQGLDSILKGTGTVYVPPEPAKTLDQLPVIKAFMVRDPIGSGSESVNRVYEQYSKTNAQMNYVKQLVKDGEGDKAKKYLEDHPDTLQAIILTATVDSFSEMNKAVDAVRDSKTLTPQEKRKRIDQIGILQTNTAKKVLESLKAKNEED